ncbi:MAG TPA: glycosyltransferase family 39 protein [Terriglobales bacterium]|nr:glycosyltransferase family 39 protein [Terriglobales bacterium]
MDSLIPFRYPAPARITPLPKATVKKPLPEPQSASLLPATWTHRHSMLALGGVTLACLLPFTAKAFNIDDPLFLWTAQQITHHPADPYGFDLVWYTIQMHMWAVTKNPPLASYYAALIGSFAGFSERAMHLAFLVPALALIAGTYQLARHFTSHPIVAAAATLFAPAVMISATGVMCDTMMLALWVWAAFFWIQGLEPHRPLYLTSSSLLLAAAALTKYFGASLIPLLIVYSIVRLRRLEKSLLYLLIPTAVLIAYQWWTQNLYGQGLLSDAVSYASSEGKDWSGVVGQTLIGLSFLGGCTLPALVFAPIIWSRKWLAALFSAAALLALFVYLEWITLGAPIPREYWGPVSLQLAFFLAAGIAVFALTVSDLRRHRDADSIFLALWIVGTFIFSTFINWTVNARSILPLIPAAAILIARRLEHAHLTRARVALPLALCALLSLWITRGDTSLANSARTAAGMIHDKTANLPVVWFSGHWGFQYYMQQFGARPYDERSREAQPGETMINPENNSNLFDFPPDIINQVLELPLPCCVITMRNRRGAGFYASFNGPLPYSFGPVPPERYSFVKLPNQ